MISLWFYYLWIYILCYCNSATVKRTNYISRENALKDVISQNNSGINKLDMPATENTTGVMENKTRVKRQSGAGKFAEASKMPQIKLLRLVLQMFKNTWDSAYIGGTHPFHHNVPKTIVKLYKEKVVEFFIPDVGKEDHRAV